MIDMHPIVQSKISELLDQIGKAYQTNEDIGIAEALMPDAYIWIDYEVNIYWSVKSFDEVKEVLRRFAKNGIMLDRFYKSDTSPIWYLKGRNSTIRLKPEWSKADDKVEGATCKLVQVGSETKTVPIFKLVCTPDKEAI